MQQPTMTKDEQSRRNDGFRQNHDSGQTTTTTLDPGTVDAEGSPILRLFFHQFWMAIGTQSENTFILFEPAMVTAPHHWFLSFLDSPVDVLFGILGDIQAPNQLSVAMQTHLGNILPACFLEGNSLTLCAFDVPRLWSALHLCFCWHSLARR